MTCQCARQQLILGCWGCRGFNKLGGLWKCERSIVRPKNLRGRKQQSHKKRASWGSHKLEVVLRHVILWSEIHSNSSYDSDIVASAGSSLVVRNSVGYRHRDDWNRSEYDVDGPRAIIRSSSCINGTLVIERHTVREDERIFFLRRPNLATSLTCWCCSQSVLGTEEVWLFDLSEELNGEYALSSAFPSQRVNRWAPYRSRN